MSGHTPGPWAVDEYMGGFDRTLPSCAIMCRDNNKVVCEIPDYTIGEFDKADARLIAAAPELLEALIGFMREFGDKTDNNANVRNARAAIAKATGAQP